MKTTADVPPQIAAEYAKAPRGRAPADAMADGYTKTKAMQRAQQKPSKGQFGLPKSTISRKLPVKM